MTMRLFHVSEEPDIREFVPRIPARKDLDPSVGLIWAIDEDRLPNFLTPRNCPRVCYHVGKNTTPEDRQRFFSSKTASYAVILEQKWYAAMCETPLYLYEFDSRDFVLQDDIAGYWVATTAQKSIAKYELHDLLGELLKRNIEVRFVDQLFDIAQQVKQSTLNWSLCRMAFAQKSVLP